MSAIISLVAVHVVVVLVFEVSTVMLTPLVLAAIVLESSRIVVVAPIGIQMTDKTW